MPKAKNMSATKKLRGQELLERLNDLRGLSKSDKAKACGYSTQAKNGKNRVNITEFMNALLDAQDFKIDSSSTGKHTHSLSYRVSVQKNGMILIGSGYTKEMGLYPGDRCEIKLGRKHIKLNVIDAKDAASIEFDDFIDEDEELDNDEID